MSERRLGRLTEWFRRRPSSLEFWELFVTSERLLWCFVGETFSSALLRADMGERDRERLDECTIEEVAAYEERNFEVPLSALERVRLTRGTRFRRAQIEIEWTDDGEPVSMTLYNTKAGDDQTELFERLAEEPVLEDVSIEIESPSSIFRRS
jgi:hypothetical protein